MYCRPMQILLSPENEVHQSKWTNVHAATKKCANKSLNHKLQCPFYRIQLKWDRNGNCLSKLTNKMWKWFILPIVKTSNDLNEINLMFSSTLYCSFSRTQTIKTSVWCVFAIVRGTFHFVEYHLVQCNCCKSFPFHTQTHGNEHRGRGGAAKNNLNASSF